MSNKYLVEKYLDGFRSGNQSIVLACLSEDVVWRLHGCQTFSGKAAFEANIMNDEFSATNTLEIKELIEDGNRVVAVGSGVIVEESNKQRSFAFCEVFVINNGLIHEVDTFHIWTS